MNISAKADYAIRATLEIAAAEPAGITGEDLANRQGIPRKFLFNILLDLKRAEIVRAQRGTQRGYRLTRSSNAISLADVIRAVDGPLANIRGERPENVAYEGAATQLRDVWIAVRASLRQVLEKVTLADVAGGALPDAVTALVQQPDAWQPH